MNTSAVENYKQISCGCCTGKAVKTGENYRIADDQCVCWMHQDSPRGKPARTCSHHAKPAA